MLEVEGKLILMNLVISIAPSLAKESASSLNLTPVCAATLVNETSSDFSLIIVRIMSLILWLAALRHFLEKSWLQM